MDEFWQHTASSQPGLISTQDLEDLEVFFGDVSDHPVPNVDPDQWFGDSITPPCLDGNDSISLPSGNANSQAQVLTPSAELGKVEEPYLPHQNYIDLIQTVKPPYSFLDLIMMALESAPEKKLTSRQIFTYVVNKFPFYKMNQVGWKSSIRHTLSVNDCFKKVARDECVKGRGCYWTLDQSCVKKLNNGKLRGQRKKYNYDNNRHKKLDDQKNVESLGSSPTLDTSSCMITAAINAMLSDGSSTELAEDILPTMQYYTEF